MENELQKFLRLTGTDEVQAMNFLQACGAISDNCVTAGDVAGGDVARALDVLTFNEKVSDGLGNAASKPETGDAKGRSAPPTLLGRA